MNKTCVLIGNPNVGKSVIFNKLSGSYAVVSNYPGTTVDLSRGMTSFGGKPYQLIDTPGTLSLIPSSEDEQVTRDMIFRERPDVIVQVADAKNLKRTLLLTIELTELKVPLVLVLNMSDEARQRGIKLDRAELEKILGVTVVETVGVTGEGVKELARRIPQARVPSFNMSYSPEIEQLIARTEALLPEKKIFKRPLAIMLASEDMAALRYVDDKSRDGIRKQILTGTAAAEHPKITLFGLRNERVEGILRRVVLRAARVNVSLSKKAGELLMRPFPGYLVALLALFVMYEFVGVFAAGLLVDLLEKRLFGGLINPFFAVISARVFGAGFINDLLMGPYGLISMALTYAFAIVFPIVGAFFLFFGFLEDSGYLPRLSVMIDRVFSVFGLNGKAVLPMVLGLGCGTMAAMSSRILETKKERLLVILLLSLAVPCSAQAGVILGMLSGLSWKVSALWFLSICGSLFLVGAVSGKVLSGKRSPFILEIPPLRLPSLGNILVKIKMRLGWYLKEAVPLFALGTFILFACDKLHVLAGIERALKPVVSGFLGLPEQVTRSFILGFLRRDYGAAGLFVLARQGALSARQVLVSTVAITLFMPCIAQCFMVVKEQGWKIAALIFFFVSLYALAFSGALNYAVVLTGILN